MWINLGKIVMIGVWAILLLNIFQPFPRPLNIFINVAMIFTVIMHGLQLALMKASQPKTEPQLSRAQQLKFFIFGVFELLSWQKKQNLDRPK